MPHDLIFDGRSDLATEGPCPRCYDGMVEDRDGTVWACRDCGGPSVRGKKYLTEADILDRLKQAIGKHGGAIYKFIQAHRHLSYATVSNALHDSAKDGRRRFSFGLCLALGVQRRDVYVLFDEANPPPADFRYMDRRQRKSAHVERNLEIVRQKNSGLTTSQIAAAHGLSRVRVGKIIRAAKTGVS